MPAYLRQTEWMNFNLLTGCGGHAFVKETEWNDVPIIDLQSPQSFFQCWNEKKPSSQITRWLNPHWYKHPSCSLLHCTGLQKSMPWFCSDTVLDCLGDDKQKVAGLHWRDITLKLTICVKYHCGTLGAVYMDGSVRRDDSIPGTWAGSPRRDLAMSLVSLENSPRVYMGTRASPGRRDLRMLKVDLT